MKRLLVLALVLAFVGSVQATESIWVGDWTGVIRNVSLTGTVNSQFTANQVQIAGLAVATNAGHAGNLLLSSWSGVIYTHEYTAAGTDLGTSTMYSAYQTNATSLAVAPTVSSGLGGAGSVFGSSGSLAGAGFVRMQTSGGSQIYYEGNGTGVTANVYSGVCFDSVTGNMFSTAGNQICENAAQVYNGTTSPAYRNYAPGVSFVTVGTTGDALAGIAVHGNYIYVADTTTDCIYKYSLSDKSLQQTIQTGGDFNPNGIVFDSTGNMYVSYAKTTFAIEKFNSAGIDQGAIATFSQQLSQMAIVPEPATLVLLGLGALTLLRKKK